MLHYKLHFSYYHNYISIIISQQTSYATGTIDGVKQALNHIQGPQSYPIREFPVFSLCLLCPTGNFPVPVSEGKLTLIIRKVHANIAISYIFRIREFYNFSKQNSLCFGTISNSLHVFSMTGNYFYFSCFPFFPYAVGALHISRTINIPRAQKISR